MRFSPDRLLQKPPQEASAGHLARLIERNRRQIDAEHQVPAHPGLATVGVAGAGAMGVRIAAQAGCHGFAVKIHDPDEQAVASAPARIAAMADHNTRIGEITGSYSPDRLQCASQIAALGDCDLILEAVPEKPDLKRGVLQELEAAATPRTVLATNTSSIPVGQLASALARPERLVGIHFLMPFGERPLLEITPGTATDAAVTATAIAFCRSLDHLPLVVRDGAGFVVNRLLMAYLGGGIDLLTAGFDVETIDRAAERFGMPAGPFRAYDEIGLDVAIHCGWAMAFSAHEQLLRSPLLVAMVKAGLLGRKTGQGFFRYQPGSDQPAAAGVSDQARALIERHVPPATPAAGQHLVAGLVLPLVLEATRLLAEERASCPDQIELASVFGIGFPRDRGGPLYWTDGWGASAVVDLLEPFADLSPRYRPTPGLLDMAASGRTFFEARES